MKKFITKTLIALFCVYLPWIFFVIYGKFYYTPIDFASWNYKHQLIVEKNFNPKDIIVGDSLAMTAINPKLISTDLFNLAQSGSTLVDAFYFLSKYLAAGKRPRKVFLSFGITHWQSSDVFREQSIAYGFMTTSEFYEFVRLTAKLPLFYKPEEVIEVFENWIPFNYFYKDFVNKFRREISFFDFFMMRSGFSPMLLNHVRNNIFEIFSEKNIKYKKDLKDVMISNDGQHLFEEQDNINRVNPKVQYSSWAIHPINKLYFEKIIELLSKHEIEMELVFVPNNPITWANFKDTFFNEMYHFLDSYNTFKGKLKYNRLIPLAIDKFGDMDHVNELGMIEYSKTFKKRYY